jgi:hypothetical protein
LSRKPSALGSSFVAHSKEMRESAAWRYLPDYARRVLDRLELEHMRHGGADNGRLPCTYSDFAAAGIRRASVAEAIRQCVNLGFVVVTEAGGRSISVHRKPSLYGLTYVPGRGKSPTPTNGWKSVKTEGEALDALARAKTEKRRSTQPAQGAAKIKKLDAPARPGPDARASLLRA